MLSHMRTTIDLPDPLFRQLKAHAALTGQTLKALLEQAIREKLQREERADTQRGWRAVFGKAPRRSVEEVQAVIDAEFDGIDLTTWR